jgi:hypothetical protein
VKIAVVEACIWIGQPLSKAELTRLFDQRECYLSLVSYHVDGLDRNGTLEIVATRELGGTTETYYFFPRHE